MESEVELLGSFMVWPNQAHRLRRGRHGTGASTEPHMRNERAYISPVDSLTEW